ncbi:hypothetical protein EV356DRAFT_518495 [Viridothelium virens]|uniref:Uncharacterized protein n=1 Tax=Viridothelium virens TaxID=1048519 RepID=A0A6A6H0U4_VIRVR|nr:hypothetical protein EV356DRAFT_518495 [Viridothelium virens]
MSRRHALESWSPDLLSFGFTPQNEEKIRLKCMCIVDGLVPARKNSPCFIVVSKTTSLHYSALHLQEHFQLNNGTARPTDKTRCGRRCILDFLTGSSVKFLSGRCMSVISDLDELEARRDKIIEKDLFNVDLKGDFRSAVAMAATSTMVLYPAEEGTKVRSRTASRIMKSRSSMPEVNKHHGTAYSASSSRIGLKA